MKEPHYVIHSQTNLYTCICCLYLHSLLSLRNSCFEIYSDWVFIILLYSSMIYNFWNMCKDTAVSLSLPLCPFPPPLSCMQVSISLSEMSPWRKPATRSWATLWRGPHGKEPKPLPISLWESLEMCLPPRLSDDRFSGGLTLSRTPQFQLLETPWARSIQLSCPRIPILRNYTNVCCCKLSIFTQQV